MVDTTQTVIFSAASLFSKLPVLFLIMLIWSGVVVGFAGQAVLLLAYTLTLSLGYAIVRPLMASIIPYEGALGKLLYSLPESISKSGSTQHEFASMFLGLPMRTTSELFGSINTSFFSKYLFMGLPDAMIFPSSFLYGYSVMSTENGVTDTRNLFMLFFMLLAMMIQKSVLGMSIFAIMINFLIGLLAGTVAASLISETPSLKPFSVPNQTFRIVVRNNN
jgi:hypothetical protein